MGRGDVCAGVRSLKIGAVLLLVFLLAQTCPAGARTNETARRSSPTVLRPRWHRVASGIEGYQDVVASDRYVAWGSGQGALTLLDERTGRRERLTPPGCPTFTGPGTFGGPWLEVGCENRTPDASEIVDLYHLSNRRWVSTQLAPGLCASNNCGVNAVGADWIRIQVSQEACGGPACGEPAELQNILTGAVKPDPADRGIHDDLDMPSAVGHPCPALRGYNYSLPYLDASTESGLLPYSLQLGRFALAPSFSSELSTSPTRLQKCHSRISHAFRAPAVGGSTRLLASPNAVLLPQIGGAGEPATLDGLFLPSLRSLEIPHFKGYPVVLSGGVLYATRGISASGSTSNLWAATIVRP